MEIKMNKIPWLAVLFILSTNMASAQQITLLLPNGGETMMIGTPQLISWTCTGMTGNEIVMIALEGKTDSGPIAYCKAAEGSIEWQAGEKADGTFARPADDYQILLEVLENDNIHDLSDFPFTIASAAPEISLMTPNGGENLERGNDFEINWAFAGKSGVVSLTLLKDELPLGLIAENLPATKFRYRWHVGDPLLNGADYGTGSNFHIQIQLQISPNNEKDGLKKAPAEALTPAALLESSDRSDGSFSIINKSQASVKTKN
jgi:hypothetical protein